VVVWHGTEFVDVGPRSAFFKQDTTGLKKDIAEFYVRQNREVEMLQQQISAMIGAKPAPEASSALVVPTQRIVDIAIKSSLALTLLLICMKMFAAIWSGSIAVIASAADSALDVLSQSTLLVISTKMKKRDLQRYPAGKARMETLGVMLFSVIMGLAAVQLLYQSTNRLVTGIAFAASACACVRAFHEAASPMFAPKNSTGLNSHPSIRMDAVTISVLGATVVLQLLAAAYCRALLAKTNGSSSVQVRNPPAFRVRLELVSEL